MRFNFRGIRGLAVVLSVAVFLLMLGGCASRPATAQKLFAQGKYQEVAEKYSDLEIGRRARAKIAEQLIAAGDFETVLKDYNDTPASYRARIAKSDLLLAQGKYEEVVKDYVNTAAGTTALNHLADSLVNAGHPEVFLEKYADSDRGKEIRENMAKAAFDSAMAMKGDAKLKALEYVNSTFMGTAVYKLAMKEHDSMVSPDKPKKNLSPASKTKSPK